MRLENRFVNILKEKFRQKHAIFFEHGIVDCELNPDFEDLDNGILEDLFNEEFLENENLNNAPLVFKRIIADEFVDRLATIENKRWFYLQKYHSTNYDKNSNADPSRLVARDKKIVEKFKELLKKYTDPPIVFSKTEIMFDDKVKPTFEVIEKIEKDLALMPKQTGYISKEHYYTEGKRIDPEAIKEYKEVSAEERKFKESYKSICNEYNIKCEINDYSLSQLRESSYKRLSNLKKQ